MASACTAARPQARDAPGISPASSINCASISNRNPDPQSLSRFVNRLTHDFSIATNSQRTVELDPGSSTSSDCCSHSIELASGVSNYPWQRVTDGITECDSVRLRRWCLSFDRFNHRSAWPWSSRQMRSDPGRSPEPTSINDPESHVRLHFAILQGASIITIYCVSIP